jgi:Uma2 family endonuclease
MSTALQSPPITVEQYERFEGYPGLKDELINGEICLSPQPKPLHQQIVRNINRLLDAALQGQIYTAQQNSNIRFRGANSMPSPDVFVITQQDWQRACEADDYLSVPPILVIEILSPANCKRRVEAKVALYLSQGVTEVWLVYPKSRKTVIHRKHFEVAAGDEIPLPAPLTGSLKTASFFAISAGT